MTSAFASRITGEALMTQRSATLEVLFQIFNAHLDWGKVMLVEQVETLAAFHFQNLRSLNLGQTSLLKPAQLCRNQHLPPKARSILAKHLRGIIGNRNRKLC